MEEPERSPEKPGRPRDEGRRRAQAQAQRGHGDGRGARRAGAWQRAHRRPHHRARARRAQPGRHLTRSPIGACEAARLRSSSTGCCRRSIAPLPVPSRPFASSHAVLAAGARRHLRRDGRLVAEVLQLLHDPHQRAGGGDSAVAAHRAAFRAGPVPIAPAGAHGRSPATSSWSASSTTYCCSGLSQRQGWPMFFEYMLHYVTPPLFVLDWLAVRRQARS